MSSDDAIRVKNLSKCFQIYDTPRDRLKQFIIPRLKRLVAPLVQIAVQNFCHSSSYYQEFWAISDVSFEVKRGESVGIIGRNGSGKSTLLQMICGTLTPTGGQVETQGRVAALLELGSGFNPEFTGRENVYMNASVLGLTEDEIDKRFDAIIDFADIGDFIEQPVRAYSSGMLVRLAFAVIAHVDADILVIDEAFAVGDAFFTQKCMRFLRRFMETGTVLFVSHDTASVRGLCARAILLEKGCVLQAGSSKDVCERYLEVFYEEGQGESKSDARCSSAMSSDPIVAKDQREEFINSTNLRNDIRLFAFEPGASSFGKGSARITSVNFCDKGGNPLSWIVGGEEVVLKVELFAQQPLNSPIVGFFIKDKLGQCLFGDNTYLSYLDKPVSCGTEEHMVAEFSFSMPRFAAGEYAITVAIAEGTQYDHIQHHWIHDAIIFKSESTSVSSGIIGIPMTNIQLKVVKGHD